MSNKTYQWIKGDNAGNVVESNGDTILQDNIEFLIFTNGTQCNTALIGDFIMEVASSHPSDLLMEPNELKPAPPPVPKPVNSTPGHRNPPPPPVKKETESANPVVSLLASSKKTKEKVLITIEMELPPADLLKVVAASFEDGEKQIFDYLVNGLSPEQNDAIRKQIAETIMSTVFVKETKTIKRKNEKLQDA